MRERISSFILIVSVILTVVFFVSLFIKKPLFYFFVLQFREYKHKVIVICFYFYYVI